MSSDPKYMQNASKVISMLISGKGVKHLMDILCDLLENPVVLWFPSNKFIYASKYKIDVEDIRTLLSTGCIPASVKDEHDIYTAPGVYNSREPFLVDQGMFSESRRIVAGIHISEAVEIAAVLTVIESNRTFRDEDMDLVSFISQVLEEEFRGNDIQHSMLYEYQLQCLLTGEASQEIDLGEWLIALGWRKCKSLYLMVALLPEIQRYAAEVSARKRFELNPNIKITRIKNRIIFLINSPTSQILSSDLFDELKTWTEEQGLRGIISHPFTDINCLSDQFELCCDALESGLLRVQKDILLRCDEIAPQHLLCLAGHSRDLNWFISPKVRQLMQYDKRYGTDYWHTLKTYLMCGNKAATVEKLGIHRNTLNYRLEKISEIIEFDFENGSERFALQLSAYAEQILTATTE